MDDNDMDRYAVARSRIPYMNDNQPMNESVDDPLLDYIDNQNESLPFIQLGTDGQRSESKLKEGG